MIQEKESTVQLKGHSIEFAPVRHTSELSPSFVSDIPMPTHIAYLVATLKAPCKGGERKGKGNLIVQLRVDLILSNSSGGKDREKNCQHAVLEVNK